MHCRFKEISEAVGVGYHHIPQFLEVRFRYVPKLARYMEDNDKPLFSYYSELAKEFKDGTRKEISETETLILEHFLGNYIHVRLQNKFILAACNHIIQFIDYFEARDVRVHKR